MVKAKLWFTCAAMHDPVTPVIARPALIGWDARFREVELQIERGFSGDELVRRMKGWVTVDPVEVIGVVEEHGRLRVLDERDLAVEVETMEDYERLSQALQDKFGEEVNLELIPKKG
ncbi:MAG: hypothetical protein JXA50_02180 [Deltaproteobacteria bacterium]|nr:hypothetical protein [Deltaproteobacteria bacterium]